MLKDVVHARVGRGGMGVCVWGYICGCGLQGSSDESLAPSSSFSSVTGNGLIDHFLVSPLGTGDNQ